jgi:hypothetical protein
MNEQQLQQKQADLLMKVRGTYGDATRWMIEQGTYSRKELIKYLNEKCGRSLDRGDKSISPAEATATILLTPRLSSTRGDIRGNVNNPWGHIAYNQKLPRTVNRITGKKEPQRFAFVFRDEELAPKKRKSKEGANKLDSVKEIIHTDNTGKDKIPASTAPEKEDNSPLADA